MNKYMLGLYEKSMPSNLSWEEKLSCAKNAGFDFVEISIDESEEKLKRLEISKEERIEIVRAMEKVGLPIRTLCLSGHRKYPLGSLNEETRNKGLWIMEKALELACDLGVRIIQLAGYDVYYEESTAESRELFKTNLKKCVDMAASYGVILAFETMETEFMNTVEKAMTYVNEINSPYLQVYPDSGNITNAAKKHNKNVIDDLEFGAGHIAAVHLKETVPDVFREVPFGTGHVAFESIIKKSFDLGVRRYVTEFWYVGNEDWMNDIKYAKTFIDEKFRSALGL